MKVAAQGGILLVLGAVVPWGTASDRCSACHAQVVREYFRSGMGRSLARPSAAHPAGIYRHGISGTGFRTVSSDAGQTQEIERDGLHAAYDIEYVIGSGNAAFGYLVRIGNSLFQSPVTYYTERRTWGMAPGMETAAQPDFTRPANAECLWCHAGRPRPVPGSVNRYESPPVEAEAISCDRCHGPAAAHLRAPTATNIFNPATAPPRERDSVCEQCHLAGEIRVLHPGQTFGSFEPGKALEGFWTVFVGRPARGSESNRFQVVSHVQQLALSRCAQRSGPQFWCGTCHNPHVVPTDAASYYSSRCSACHGDLAAGGHADGSADCIRCHMPRRQSHDSGHSAFTDHRIARIPRPQGRTAARPAQLRPWKPVRGPLGRRNLGIANILAAQRYSSPSMLQDGIAQLQNVVRRYEHDPAVHDALGTALVLSGAPGAGLRHLRRAAELGEGAALHSNALAAAAWDAGLADEAVAALEGSIRHEPLLESSYHLLARIHQDAGRTADERETWRRLLQRRPRLIQARQRLRRAAAP